MINIKKNVQLFFNNNNNKFIAKQKILLSKKYIKLIK